MSSLRNPMLIFAFICAEQTSEFHLHPLDLMDGFHVDHDESQLHHTHEFVHKCEKSAASAFLSYNVTKCAKHQYIRIPNTAQLCCLSDKSIKLIFTDAEKVEKFRQTVEVGLILTSHINMRCEVDGKGILMEITRIKWSGKLICEIQGVARQPMEFFQHAKIEFTTNIMPDAGLQRSKCSAARHSRSPSQSDKFLPLEYAHKNSAYLSAAKKLRSNSTKIDSFEDLTQAAYNYYSSLESTKYTQAFSDSTTQLNFDKVASPGSWRVPFPSDIFWEDPMYTRMLCIDCSLHMQPTIRFSIHIENYVLKSFQCILEGNTFLAIRPHVHIDDNGAFQRLKLLERSFRPVYICFGGIPYFITPHFRASLKLSHKVSAEARIGIQTSFIGVMRVGMVQEGLRIQPTGNLSLQQSPTDFSFQIGKSCRKFDGESFLGSMHDCARQCEKDASCVAFKYNKGTGKCYLTGKCDEVDTPETGELLFQHDPWEKPEPNPQLQGTVRIMVTTHTALLINGIGGPMVSINNSLNWNFMRTDMQTYRQTRITFRVTGAVGGRVELRAGNSCVYEDDLKFKPLLAYTETLWKHDYPMT